MNAMLLLWILGSGALTYALHREGLRLSTKPAPEASIQKTETPILAYCGTCRSYFLTEENPPYGVIHVLGDVPEHLHAITRTPMRPYLTREEFA